LIFSEPACFRAVLLSLNLPQQLTLGRVPDDCAPSWHGQPSSVAALDSAHRPYRIAASSASLSGLRAAVRGGIAITLRTARWIGDDVVEVSPTIGLPLPDAEFPVRLRRDADPAAAALAHLLCDALDAPQLA